MILIFNVNMRDILRAFVIKGKFYVLSQIVVGTLKLLHDGLHIYQKNLMRF